MAETQTNLAWDTLLELEGPTTGPLHERLGRAVRRAIRDGRLPPNSALPPSRRLAADLGCSRWVVTEAYEQLVAEGYLDARIGSATRVRWPEPPSTTPTASPARVAWTPRFDLGPGLPDLRAFPRARWIDALRAEASAAPFTDLGYPASRGHPRLRGVIAEYLRRVRGAVTQPTDVTVTTGTTDGVTRVIRALREKGVTRVAVEDPGWYRLRNVVSAAGLDPVPIPLDEHGLRVDELEQQADVGAAIITPAHQFPTGSVLAPARRAATLDWARRVDAVLLEDDDDAEFRYDRRPIGTVQGMDPARVILFGSLSKTLSPALGIGWMVSPPDWTARLGRGELSPRVPPLWTSWRSRASSNRAPTTGTCGPRAGGTGPGAMHWSPPLHGTCRIAPSPGSPRDCTCCFTCRLAWIRPRSSPGLPLATFESATWTPIESGPIHCIRRS